MKIIRTVAILSIIISLQACNENTKNENEKTESTHTMMHSSEMSDSSNYTCPMHKNKMGMKGDKCTECGMDMEEMTYSCPMHNDMMGMKGDKCSECGMDMEEMKDMNH